MGLTRKDFFQLARVTARIINKVKKNTQEEAVFSETQNEILEEIENFCRGQNALFDAVRFEAEVNKWLENAKHK